MTPREEANKVPLLESLVVCIGSIVAVATAPLWLTAIAVKQALDKDKEKK
jgi:hypothetical protein